MDEKLEALEMLRDYLNRLSEGIIKACEYFRTGDVFNGSSLVTQIGEGFEWVLQAVNVTQDIHTKKIDTAAISVIFQEIVEALSNEDYILVADLFEYEIIPVLEEWKLIINSSLV